MDIGFGRISLTYDLSDISGLYALYDHKKAMLCRMKFMKDDRLQSIISQYEQVLLASHAILNLQLKYNAYARREILVKIKDKLTFVYKSDMDILSEFLEFLRLQ